MAADAAGPPRADHDCLLVLVRLQPPTPLSRPASKFLCATSMPTGPHSRAPGSCCRPPCQPPPPPTAPQVVTDQLRLWQAERSRLRAQPAAVYSRFESPELFSGAVEFARQAGALLYSSQERQQLAVHSSFHDAMRGHLRDRKMALGL